MNVHHSLSTLLFSPYLTVCDSENFPTESFHKKVLKDLSLRKFSPEGPPQKIPSSLFLSFPEGCLQKVPLTSFPQKVQNLRRFSLESSSWKLPLQFLQKFPLVVSIRSFPKMFPLKGSLQKFSLRRFPQKLPLEGYCWRLPLGMLLSEGFPQRDSLESFPQRDSFESFPSAVVEQYLAFLYIAHSITSGLKP